MCLVSVYLQKMAEVVNNKTAAQNTQKWRSAEMVIRVKVPVTQSRGIFSSTSFREGTEKRETYSLERFAHSRCHFNSIQFTIRHFVVSDSGGMANTPSSI